MRAERRAQWLEWLAMSLVAWHAGAQVSGNIAYAGAGGKARASADQRQVRVLSKEDLPPENSMFVDASVLLNMKADEYVAVFAVDREGTSTADAEAKMNATLSQFTAALSGLHVRDSDIYVDYISEPKVYGYEVSEAVARERLNGFELKKNVSVHYTERNLLPKLLTAAAGAEIYDLVKVDYVLRDVNAVQQKLIAEASGVIQQKLAADEKLLGVKVKSTPAIYAERSAVYYPAELYDSYTAAEAESLSHPANLQRLTIQQARKSRTFFFNPLDANGFDKVINPVVLEPVVQCTLYLKVKYEIVH